MKRFLLKTAACWWPALASAVPLPSQSLSISSLDLEDDTVYFQRSVSDRFLHKTRQLIVYRWGRSNHQIPNALQRMRC